MDKPFQCDVWDKVFNTLSDLQSHKKIHTGEKPFKCDVCDIHVGLNQIGALQTT